MEIMTKTNTNKKEQKILRIIFACPMWKMLVRVTKWRIHLKTLLFIAEILWHMEVLNPMGGRRWACIV